MCEFYLISAETMFRMDAPVNLQSINSKSG